MSNIRKWLEAAERHFKERIETIVVGEHYNGKPGKNENILLSREDGLKKLDKEFDSGYGGADCYPMYAWTATRVFFIREYDGATGLEWLPRHPIPTKPYYGTPYNELWP